MTSKFDGLDPTVAGSIMREFVASLYAGEVKVPKPEAAAADLGLTPPAEAPVNAEDDPVVQITKALRERLGLPEDADVRILHLGGGGTALPSIIDNMVGDMMADRFYTVLNDAYKAFVKSNWVEHYVSTLASGLAHSVAYMNDEQVQSLMGALGEAIAKERAGYQHLAQQMEAERAARGE